MEEVISYNDVIYLVLYLRPPCEHVVRHLLPAFRSLVAKKLIEEYGFSQVATAKKLGTTQAAVSHYLHLKRGKKRARELESMPIVQSTANEVARSIATGKFSVTDAMLTFCKLCNALRKQDSLHILHRKGTFQPMMI